MILSFLFIFGICSILFIGKYIGSLKANELLKVHYLSLIFSGIWPAYLHGNLMNIILSLVLFISIGFMFAFQIAKMNEY